MVAVPAVRGGRRAGGILSLVRLRQEHRAAVDYDWRTRFGLPFSEVGASMTWGEAVRLIGVLIKDPTSQIAAAIAGWKRPWSHEWAVTADLFDRLSQAHFKSPKPYPRPWPDPNVKRRGRTDKPRSEVISILNAHGHSIAG